MKRFLCVLMTLVVLLAAVFAGCQKTEEPVSGSAPDFTVQDGDGREVKLSDYFGKPIVLNLWASWCPPCKAEMPHFEAAYKAYADVQFLMINLTVSDTYEAADQMIADAGYTFPVFYDTTGAAAIAYNASAIPVSVFIDKNGDVVNHKVGMLTEAELEENIRAILK